MNELDADAVIDLLGLAPLSDEGGFYREGYRSQETVSAEALPDRYAGPRSLGTAIYYLLRGEEYSRLHRLKSDEVYHFYLGDPVEMVQLLPDGSGRLLTIGPELSQGMRLQTVVPAGVWQGAVLREGGKWALMGTTVSPGFEFQDREIGDREELLGRYPGFAEMICLLT